VLRLHSPPPFPLADAGGASPARYHLMMCCCVTIYIYVQDLGVEAVSDFKDVTEEDLDAIGLKKIEKNRFKKALAYAE
jgi:hypothetical protein